MICTDRVKNGVLHCAKEERNILHTRIKRLVSLAKELPFKTH
jgi:hypothetical protein